VVVVYTIAAPGIPTSVTGTAVSTSQVNLSWAAPASGGPVTSYDVRLNGGTPTTGATSPHSFTGLTPSTTYTLEVRAVGPGGTSSWVSASATTLDAPPGIPTSVTATVVSSTQLDLSWAAPATGGPVTSYQVRIDGGTPTTATSPHAFTGLTPDTSYTLEVRAVGPGGTSSWVSASATTPADMPTTDYQADIRVGAHTWTINAGDDVDPEAVNVLDGASFTWAAPDDVGWPPPLHVVDRDVCTLRLYTPDAQDVGDIRRGDVVRFKFTPAGYTFTHPLVDFAGRVRAVKVEDRTGGGAFLQLTAADHTVTLQEWTVAGETPINAPDDTFEDALVRISEVLDTLESAYERDWVPGTFGNVLDGATPGELAEYAGHLPDGYTIAADELTTAFDLFAHYGINMFPVPNYDDGTGDLDATHPFLVRPMDRYARDSIEAAVDSCLVPTESVEWQRDYTPNVVESTAADQYWVGENYGDPIPDYPDWNLLRVSGDALVQPFFPDVNITGIINEVPEPGPWGPYTFTVLGWREPESVAGWLTIPDRYRTYVTLTGVEPTWNPNGDDTVAGMLRGATWSIGPNGRWVVDAGLRRSRGHPDGAEIAMPTEPSPDTTEPPLFAQVFSYQYTPPAPAAGADLRAASLAAGQVTLNRWAMDATAVALSTSTQDGAVLTFGVFSQLETPRVWITTSGGSRMEARIEGTVPAPLPANPTTRVAPLVVTHVQGPAPAKNEYVTVAIFGKLPPT